MHALVFLMLWWMPLAVNVNDPAILRQLNAPDPAIRTTATQTLLQDPNLTLEQIETLLQKSPHLEQRHRLLDVAKHLVFRQLIEPFYQSSRKGSLGVRLYEPPVRGINPGIHPLEPEIEDASKLPNASTHGIIIGRTLPGFPAYAYLQRGDIIVAINQTPLPKRRNGISMTKACIAMITIHPPGKEIQLDLIRNHKPLSVTFPLAPFEALAHLYEHKQVKAGQRITLTATALEQWNKQLQRWGDILQPQEH